MLAAETPLGQRTNSLWMETHVVSGSAKALVIRTGKDTEFGKVSERLRLRPQDKDIVDANKRLKDELNKLYYEQTDALKDVLVRLPIIDCSDAFWPFLGIWKRRLREHSKKEGIHIL